MSDKTKTTREARQLRAALVFLNFHPAQLAEVAREAKHADLTAMREAASRVILKRLRKLDHKE